MKQEIEKKRILIIDDEEINVLLLKNNLQALYHIDTAFSGDEAFQKTNQILPDLILLDIMMPDLDGYEICKLYKSKLETKNIPIIFLTVKNSEYNKIKGFELGASDYIVKPFRPKIDLHRIAIHLKYSKSINNIGNSNHSHKSSKGLLALENVMKELYGFTNAEAKLSNGLINGYTLEEIAADSGVGYATLRGYLRNVFCKTNTKKQHELVSTILTSVLL